jgi:hypothetical protein
MSDDPFAPENDPYGAPERGRVGRRAALLGMAGAGALACAAASAGCVPRRLACAPAVAGPGEPACEHRFCRYYRRGPV